MNSHFARYNFSNPIPSPFSQQSPWLPPSLASLPAFKTKQKTNLQVPHRPIRSISTLLTPSHRRQCELAAPLCQRMDVLQCDHTCASTTELHHFGGVALDFATFHWSLRDVEYWKRSPGMVAYMQCIVTSHKVRGGSGSGSGMMRGSRADCADALRVRFVYISAVRQQQQPAEPVLAQQKLLSPQ
jgi:hypothetical protein